MTRILWTVLALPLALAACGGGGRLTPAPGEAPGWPSPTPPRPSYAPLPFRDTYLPATAVQEMPPVPPGQNVPYAVPPGAGPAAAPTANQPCHKVPPVTFEGRTTSTVCRQADGTWMYVPD